MYEWIDDIDKVVQDLTGEMNDTKTRIKVAQKIMDILKFHEVKAFVDCSSQVNNSEVINHGEFRASVVLNDIEVMFKFRNTENIKKQRVI